MRVEQDESISHLLNAMMFAHKNAYSDFRNAA